MKKTLVLAAALALLGASASAQTTTDQTGNADSQNQCQAGQVLQANGQSCLPKVASPQPVQSTSALGQFPTDLLPTQTPSAAAGSSSAGACQPGQAISSTGAPCN